MNGWKHWCKGNTKDCAQLTADDILPGSLLSDNKTALAGLKVLSYIVGTWNFINETREGSMSTSTAGTITFKGGRYDPNGGSASFIETINGKGKIVHAIIGCQPINGKTVCGPIANSTSGESASDGHVLSLSYNGGPGVILTFTTTSPNHMELTDEHGNTIHLMR
jgi:hypothetical protein